MNTARPASPDEVARWDELVLANADGGEFLQQAEFGDVKASQGWRPRYIVADSTAVLALERRVPVLGRLWYVPRGPGVSDVTELRTVAAGLRDLAKRHGVFAIKIEPPLAHSEENLAALDGFLERATRVQPTLSTVWLDVRPSLDALEQSFSGKTRYNIRRARKHGVECRALPPDEATYRQVYELFAATAAGRFSIRSFDYYRRFWDGYCATGYGLLMGAFHGEDLIAADFVMLLGARASRKDAASTKHTVRGGPALLVVETIRELQRRGVTDYDLCGAPESWRRRDPEHPLAGVGTFKTGFNDEITDYVGTYLIPVHPVAAAIFQRYGERILRGAWFRLRHEPWY